MPTYSNARSLRDVPRLTRGSLRVFPIATVYEKAILSSPRDDRTGVIHPSAIGGCARRSMYELVGMVGTNNFDANMLERFELGHGVHNIVQSRLERDIKEYLENDRAFGVTQYKFEREIPFDPETDELYLNYRIGGTTDGVLELQGDGWCQRAVVEVKSICKGDFEKLEKSGQPMPDHLLQAHIYAYRYDCPLMFIWYYCKDNSKRCVFAVLFDFDVFERVIDIATEINVHLAAGTLPERDESWFMCKSCGYKRTCDPVVLRRKKDDPQAKPTRNR